MFYSLAFLFKTGCIDPGIVPRSRPDEVAYQAALGEEGMCMCVCVCRSMGIIPHCAFANKDKERVCGCTFQSSTSWAVAQ